MKKIKIYYTSDVHGYVYPTDYTDFSDKNMGILKFSSLFKKDENTLIIDGGDTIQGSPFTTFLSKNPNDYKGHPIAKLFNRLKYDYITLGNHDFNYGENYLMNYIHSSNAKTVCCNAFYTKEPHLIKPYDIKEINGIKIGIIGATTQFINVWERKENLENFKIIDPYEAVKETIDLIKDQIDYSIVVYHGGFERDVKTSILYGKDTGENQAYKMAENLDIDLLLTGHQHLEIHDQLINGTYIVQTPPNAAKVCELTIEFPSKSIKSTFNIPEQVNDEVITDELTNIEKKVQHWLDVPIGHLAEPINPENHLEMALNGHPLAHFQNDIQLEISGADLSCTSLSNEVKGFNKDITIRDIVSTYKYPNTLVIYKIDGKTLKQGLERSAEYFTIINDEIHISDAFLKPKVEHYNYDYFRGIDYTINVRNEKGNRIENLTYMGKPIKEEDTFTIVMNNYRSTGTGGYEFYKNCTLVKEILIDTQEMIIDYILKNPELKINKKNNYIVKY